MEQDFIEIWKSRDSHLEGVPGFKSFNLLQGHTFDEYTLFASHTIWESEQAFEDWTQSEAFRKAHAHAGEKTKDVYLGPPQLEWFNSVI
jgi:heme-degrading monooxygenase HmoA